VLDDFPLTEAVHATFCNAFRDILDEFLAIMQGLDDVLKDDEEENGPKIKEAVKGLEALKKTFPTQELLDHDSAKLKEEAISSSCNIDFVTGELESDEESYGEDFDEDIYEDDYEDEEEVTYDEMEGDSFENCYDLSQNIIEQKRQLAEAESDEDKAAIE